MASVTQLRRAVPAPARGQARRDRPRWRPTTRCVLDGVTRAFGALRAVDDVSLSVAAGQKYAILGSNGAGKTTLFNAITGDFPPTAGRIYFFGEDITELPPHERIRKGLRRTYQSSLLFRELSGARQPVPGGARRVQRPLRLPARAREPCQHAWPLRTCWNARACRTWPTSWWPTWRTASSVSWRSAWRWPARRG